MHAGLPAWEGFGGDLEGDAGFALREVVEKCVGSVDHHEVGACSESGFEEFRQIGIPDGLVFYEGENLGLGVSNRSCSGVIWHKCFVLIQRSLGRGAVVFSERLQRGICK